jgi:Zn ribbon nucleic-acid-binding protein
MSIWHEITQGAKAVVHPGPSRFVAGGLPVRCPHCQAEEFIEGSALLSTVGISFAHLNWATEEKVTTLMCDQCGLIQWFGVTPQMQ